MWKDVEDADDGDNDGDNDDEENNGSGAARVKEVAAGKERGASREK